MACIITITSIVEMPLFESTENTSKTAKTGLDPDDNDTMCGHTHMHFITGSIEHMIFINGYMIMTYTHKSHIKSECNLWHKRLYTATNVTY